MWRHIAHARIALVGELDIATVDRCVDSVSLGGGCEAVCGSDAFRDVGGFNQALYAADEIGLRTHLKQGGRQRGLQFIILTKHPLETSSRKMALYSGQEIAGQIQRVILHPYRTLQDKKQLSIWYVGRRGRSR